MFKTRLLSGIVLVILALFLIISGHEILLFEHLPFPVSECLNYIACSRWKRPFWKALDIWRQSFITVIYSGSFCRIL